MRLHRSLAVAAVLGLAVVNAPAATAVDHRAEAAAALGRGDGQAAADAIKAAYISGDAEALAEVIYAGGVLAVKADKGDAFSDAVPVAFMGASVTFTTANRAFSSAAGTFLQNSPTPEQGRAGFLTIVKTEAAYASTGSFG